LSRTWNDGETKAPPKDGRQDNAFPEKTHDH
jgi:hypothetical protein